MIEERVFVVPRASIADSAAWYGIRTDDLDVYVEALERDGRYEPRPLMEVDPSFKQVIPYLILRDGERYFLMRRTRAGVDARLHDRYSIGVGGHLNPGDGGVLGGLRREWREELVADFEPRSGSWGCSTTTRPRSAQSTSARSTWPRRPAARSRSARPTS